MEHPKVFGYARVSTKKQSLKMQVDALKKYGCGQITQEKISALADRPIFEDLINNLHPGETLVVWKLDRLGRSMIDLIRIIATLEEKGVKFVSLTENIDTSTQTGKMMLMLFSMMAEYEISLRKERQDAVKEQNRLRGKLGGRPKGLSLEAKKTAEVLKHMYQEKDEEGNFRYSISKLTAALKISKGTLYKYLRVLNIKLRC